LATAFELPARFFFGANRSPFSGLCFKAGPHSERPKYSVVLKLVVGSREVVFARLNVGATNRVPTSSMKCFVGFRGKPLTLPLYAKRNRFRFAANR